MDRPRPAVIRKTAADLRLPPKIADWEAERRCFCWDTVWGDLGAVPGGVINIGMAATDRHLGTPVQDRVALRFLDRNDGDRYLTGDLAKRDADGYYWFVGRADDVIKSAGRPIGPFEVESALMEHPAVAYLGARQR